MESQTYTEAQMYTAAMLLTMETALSELYPGRVSSKGSLWKGQSELFINDMQSMIVDFEAREDDEDDEDGSGGSGDSRGIRVSVIRNDKTGDPRFANPERSFEIPINADQSIVDDFIEDFVVDTAKSISLDPKMLVRKIHDLSMNAPKLRNLMGGKGAGAGSGTEMVPPAPVTPG